MNTKPGLLPGVRTAQLGRSNPKLARIPKRGFRALGFRVQGSHGLGFRAYWLKV